MYSRWHHDFIWAVTMVSNVGVKDETGVVQNPDLRNRVSVVHDCSHLSRCNVCSVVSN